jgi:hypothetical protein
MKKYAVSIQRNVEAESEEEARKKAVSEPLGAEDSAIVREIDPSGSFHSAVVPTVTLAK